MLIKEALEHQGHHVDVAETVAQAVELFKEHTYDLILCDVKLEGINGVEFVYLVKSMAPSMQVFVLSSSSDIQDEMRCLELGVEEYISKPFNLEALMMRLEAIDTLKEHVNEDYLRSEAEHVEVELKKRKVYKNNRLIRLSFLEYQLLVYFLKNRNVALSRHKIIKDVWHEHGQDTNFRTVDTHVKKIRSKLDLDAIVSIRSVGYEWYE